MSPLQTQLKKFARSIGAERPILSDQDNPVLFSFMLPISQLWVARKTQTFNLRVESLKKAADKLNLDFTPMGRSVVLKFSFFDSGSGELIVPANESSLFLGAAKPFGYDLAERKMNDKTRLDLERARIRVSIAIDEQGEQDWLDEDLLLKKSKLLGGLENIGSAFYTYLRTFKVERGVAIARTQKHSLVRTEVNRLLALCPHVSAKTLQQGKVIPIIMGKSPITVYLLEFDTEEEWEGTLRFLDDLYISGVKGVSQDRCRTVGVRESPKKIAITLYQRNLNSSR